jgi:hypothetical protein
MRISGFRYALCSCVAAAMLAACGGSQPPVSAPGAMPQSRAIATHAERAKSWMLPEAKDQSLLYVPNSDPSGGGYVSVYSYPHGDLMGTLTEFSNPDGVCVDNVRNIYITDEIARDITEYAHGGSQSIKTLADSGQPVGCAVDPITGNLAVANLGGTVAIYRNATRNAKYVYFSTEGDAYFCGYDDSGDLFVDGLSYQGLDDLFQLAKLPRGKRNFEVISTNQTVESPGQVQWDGKYLAVGDAEQHLIYRVSVTGTSGVVKKTVQLTDGGANGFLIRGARLIDASYFYAEVQYFKYPAGGSATKVITDGASSPASAAISLK